MKRYGIFGGSFDPPHLCHKEIAVSSVERLSLDMLFVVPTYLSPFKTSFAASPQTRYEWLCEMFATNERVKVLDIEIRKQKSVYMIDTAAEIAGMVGKQKCDKIYLIIGSDNLAGFERWHRYEELINMLEPVVVQRGDMCPHNYKTLFLECGFSSSGFRESVDSAMIPSEIRGSVMSFYSKESLDVDKREM